MVCDCTLKALGWAAIAFVAARIAASIYRIVWPFFIGPALGSAGDLKKRAGGKWAVVTGATDGIGRAYADELARLGFPLVLVSRTQGKLDATKKEIVDKFGVEVQTIQFDFSAGTLAQYQPLLEKIRALDVGILVNNVGASYEYPELLHKVEGGLEKVAAVTTMNTLSVSLLTAVVCEQFTRRGNGVVVNLSSAASYAPFPFWATYTASKAFVRQFTDALRLEYAADKYTGITFQTVCPMVVTTNMSKVRRQSWASPSPSTFARQAIRTIGLVDETAGYYAHQVQVELIFGLPFRLVAGLLTSTSLGLRKAALKKKERDQKAQ